jgi:hypothetical protein
VRDQRPPLCDQYPWNHIRHRCCCVFDFDSDIGEPLEECGYHARLRRRLADAERLLDKYRFCGDAYPRGGWPDINAFLGVQGEKP